MKLIVGLGNPGRNYAHNRHNVGFTCLNHFARKQGIKFDSKQGRARTGTGKVAGNKVVLAKPQTYMNQSGQSVGLLVRKLKINLDDLIVVHDDLNLPLGKIRIRRGDGSGGHKGIDSVIVELGSRDFLRVRVGIGRPAAESTGVSEDDVIDYVLGNFTPDQERVIAKVVPVVSEVILCLLIEGNTAAMNKYN